MAEGWGRRSGEGVATSRRDSPNGFSSVPGHCTLLAGSLFTHTPVYTHSHTSMQRQMTVNEYNNGLLGFFYGGGRFVESNVLFFGLL